MRTEAIDRVALVFSLFDANGNGNGHLDPEDFELMTARVIAAAEGADPAARERIAAAFRRYWETLSNELDTDRDGKITPDEFQACVLAPERFAPTVREFAESLAALGDPDGDGLIERPLFLTLMDAIGFRRAHVEALFDAFGPDSSDRITVEKWIGGIEDFYAPDKAGIPGDRLVGAGG
ncbi:EF-hand domain-containing protein [Streptomyces sp. NPDC059575]|uniref:EF-hand domain-containing protein n=1 Tax=Streptomyces sp. NPDC059575 TaxID=3346872 RepID=UPI00368DE3D9